MNDRIKKILEIAAVIGAISTITLFYFIKNLKK